MNLFVILLGLFLCLALLLCLKTLLGRERLVCWGKNLLGGISWILGAGLFFLVAYLAYRFTIMPTGIFFIFLVFYFIFRERKNKSFQAPETDGYRPIRTIRRPIIIFTKIGLFISFVLMISLWIIMY